MDMYGDSGVSLPSPTDIPREINTLHTRAERIRNIRLDAEKMASDMLMSRSRERHSELSKAEEFYTWAGTALREKKQNPATPL